MLDGGRPAEPVCRWDVMGEFCFVHAANIHLDTPFEGGGVTPQTVSTLLRDASLHAWESLVRLTIESRAACLLLAGGLYDGPDNGRRAPVALRNGLETLAEHQIPVFVVWGGRDANHGCRIGADWPSNVTIFGSSWSSVALRRDGTHLATIHGVSRPPRDAVQRLRGAFGPTESLPFHIGLVHGAVESDVSAEPCAQLSLPELLELPVRYWALGHHPARRTIREDPWVVYPGTPQARRATEEAGGAMVAQVADGEVRDVSFASVDVLRFRSLVIGDVTHVQRTDILRQALDRARRLRRENEGRALLLNLCLRGRSGLLEELSGWLVSELRTRTEDWNPLVWWTVSEDWTEREPARAVGAEHGELDSLLLDRSRALLGAALPRSDFLARELGPLRAVWDAELDLEETRTLLKEATSLALEKLSEAPVI